MAATRMIYAVLPVDDVDRLRFIARRRDMELHEFAAFLLGMWLAGPGQRELLEAVAGEPNNAQIARARRPRKRTARGHVGVPGQLQLVDDDYPPF